jgi:hypothetical protein
VSDFTVPESDRVDTTEFGDSISGRAPAGPRVAKDIGDAVFAGLKAAPIGMLVEGKLPDVVLGQDAPWYHRAASGLAGTFLDLPLMAVGGVLGGAAGGAAGTAVAPGVGTAAGGVLGVGAGAFAVPMALREALTTAYGHDAALSWGGVWDIAKSAMSGGGKGAVLGAATLGAGAVVGRTVMGAVAPSVGQAIGARTAVAAVESAAFATELATLTTAAAALEGHMPTWQDFMDNAIILGGVKGAMSTAGGLRNIYAQTGRRPEQVVADARRDPAIRDALLGKEHGDPKLPQLEKAMSEIDRLVEKYKDENVLVKQYFKDGDFDRGAARILEKHSGELSKETLDTLMPRMARDSETGESIMAADSVRGTHIFDLREEIAQRRFAIDELAASSVPPQYRQLALEQRVQAATEVDRPALVADIVRQAQSPDAPLKAEPVRYEYITDKATAEGVIRQVATEYQQYVESQRRGAVPTAESIAEGVRQVTEGQVARHEVGNAANAAEIAARAILTKGAAERARGIAQEIANLRPEQVTTEHKLQMAGAIEQVRLFYGELAGVGAEAGRALHMLREIKRNPDRLGDAEAMLKAYEAKGGVENLAAIVNTLKTPEQVRKFAEGYERASTLDMVLEAWKASILSGIHTTGANVVGNVTRYTVETALTNPLTQSIEAARLMAKGTPMPMATYKAKVLAPLLALKLGASDSVKLAAEVWKQKGEHLEKGDLYKKAIPGTVGDYVRLPFRFLQVQDVFFRTFGERAKAYELAVERAAKEFDPSTREFADAVQRYTETPQLGLTEKAAQEVTKAIEKHGQEWVFTERLGPRMENVSRAIQGTSAEFIFPFRKTPINLVSWSLQHTPLMNFMSSRWRADFAAGGESRSRAIARVTVGTGLALMAFQMAEEGVLTGSGLFDKEEGRAKRGAGWQPNSLRIGDTYYNIERIEPVAKVLITAANLYELQQMAKEKQDKAKIGAMVALLFGNATVSTTYMSGMSNAMAAVKEPERFGDAFFEQYATSLVPKAIGQTVTALDPERREVDGVLQAIQSQIPILRSKLLPARDAWGETVPNKKLLTVLPIQVSEASKDKVKTEAMRLGIAIADAPKTAIERGPFKPSERGVEFTQEERNIYREVSGKFAMEILAPIVNADDWDALPAFVQTRIYDEALKAGRKQGALVALPPDAAAREAMREKIIERVLKETMEAEQK